MKSATELENVKGVTIATPTYPWENRRDRVLEGATVMKANGRIFLAYAAGSTDATYCIGLLSAKDSADTNLLDPASWTKTPYPLMISDVAAGQFGTGHATFTVAEDGVTPILSYHARPNEAYSGVSSYNPLYDATRYARVAVIYFHEDGSPYFGIPPADGYLPGAGIKGVVTVTDEGDKTVPDVLWYSFDKQPPVPVADETGNGRDAALYGTGAAIEDGIRGGGLVLNKNNQNNGYAQIASGTFTDVSDFTIASWIKLSAFDGWARIFDLGRSSTQGYMFLAPTNGSATGNMVYAITKTGNGTGAEQTISVPTPFTLGKWTHVAVTQKGETVKIYIDGVEYASKDGFTNNPANSIATNTSNYIGRSHYSSDRYLRGGVDDFRVYGRALSAEEISSVMAQNAPKITTLEKTELTTVMGVLPKLPSTINAVYDDGTNAQVAVNWLNLDPARTYGVKTLTVYGEVGGTDTLAEAVIDITSMSVNDDFGVTVAVNYTESPTVGFAVSNYAADAATVRLISAVYDEAGVLYDYTLEDVTVGGGAYVLKTRDALVPENSVYTIKAFVWDESYVPIMSAAETLNAALDDFVIPDADDIRGNVTLPSELPGGIRVKWTSGDESVISDKAVKNDDYDDTPAGVVTRDENEDKTVALTAEFTLNDTTIVKEYELTVVKKPVLEPLKGYLLAGFANNGSQDIQQIHFSLSEDGNFYSDMLNGGEPVITSSLGTQGLRDPYIIRSPEGDRFYLIATDLDARGGNWGEYSTNGSLSIMIWESNDLVNWSDQRMVKVAPDGRGNCWAPESVYDAITGEYIVFWSSRNTQTGNGHCIMYAKTRDFVTFTPAEVFTSQATTGIIDSTIIYNEADRYYYRFTKWEYAASGFSANSIYVEKAPRLLHTDWQWVTPGQMIVSGGYEGPAIFKYNGENKWGLMVDEYATGQRRRFVPMFTNDLSTGLFAFPAAGQFQMPTDKRACHGVVLPVTQREYEAIAAKWGTPVYKNRP
jgi:hypothetical protein